MFQCSNQQKPKGDIVASSEKSATDKRRERRKKKAHQHAKAVEKKVGCHYKNSQSFPIAQLPLRLVSNWFLTAQKEEGDQPVLKKAKVATVLFVICGAHYVFTFEPATFAAFSGTLNRRFRSFISHSFSYF